MNTITEKCYIYRIGITFLVIFALITVSSCSDSVSPGFDKYVCKEGVVHFSFEYPDFYLRPPGLSSFTANSTKINTLGYTIEPGKGIELLFIDIFKPTESFPNSKQYLEYCTEISRKFSEEQERLPIVVDGILSEVLILTSYQTEYHLSYQAFFDADGMIWNIRLYADQFVIERSQADFEHILSTFKILD